MLLDRAEELLELDDQARVLDLGAGTGRVTRELVRRFEHVVAIEPDERMRALHGEAIAGSAEAIPLEDASVDAVFVGEAFHWFDPEAAIPEIARVLRPRGGLAILWTHWWETEPPLPERGARAVARAVGSLPAAASPTVARRVRRLALRAATGTSATPTRSRSTPDELLTLYSTTSSLASLPANEREALFDRVPAAARGALPAAAQARAHLDAACLSSSSRSAGGACG